MRGIGWSCVWHSLTSCGFPLVSILVSLSLDHKDRRSVGSEGATVGGEGSKSKGESSGIEGSREADFPATPLNHHMMMKKSVAIDRPRTPSPPITTISPSSPTHTQVHIVVETLGNPSNRTDNL